jgi:dipeptidyl aminopeptidase/acylaminoacyl peptidase
VLMIHGGPKMLYSDVYSHDIQLLCASGCYVLCTNPMGSDGRGDAFADIRGSFAELPFAQLMKSVDTLLQQNPEIDPARLGVTGGSYGGYMTNYIITRTGRFAAAVCERGISSLMSSFTTSDIGYQFVSEYLDTGSPGAWASPATVMENSPLCRADTVTTPTLFIHGENDYRCCSCESLAMFNALNYHGVDTRFCLFSGEGHGLTVRGKPAAKQRRYQEMTGWFTRYLALKSSEQTEMR